MELRRNCKTLAALAVVGVLAAGGTALATAASGRSSGPDHRYGGATSPFANAAAEVHVRVDEAGRSRVSLHVTGVEAEPGTTFGAHVHQARCTLVPAESGLHYQHAGAAGTLEAREVWLDFRVNAAGNGHAQAVRPWVVDESVQRSVVLHALGTDPVTGAAGPRLACIDLDGIHP